MDIGTEELSHLEVIGNLARMHLKPLKEGIGAEADPLVAIAGGGGVALVNSMGDAWTVSDTAGPPSASAGVPHSGQNLAPGGKGEPQLEQPASSRVPHSGQNFCPGWSSCWQFGQRTIRPPRRRARALPGGYNGRSSGWRARWLRA